MRHLSLTLIMIFVTGCSTTETTALLYDDVTTALTGRKTVEGANCVSVKASCRSGDYAEWKALNNRTYCSCGNAIQ